ncbi:MAG: outer membrane protein assembly factor BamA [Bacteroidetes bacterium]|nr:outer membrane protein assembly factor BamA [Bacteroidota bacterium]MBL0095815.1 outer membrane protein assembly factor BamA [Bacteroidota bacterium]
MLRVYSILLLFFIFLSSPLAAQIETIGGVDQEIDFGNPKEFELGGITVTGVQFLDERVLITLTGLNIGERYKIPGDKISGAIENLWKQGLLSDIKVVAEKITGDRIFLNFQLVERPRLSKFSFSGISKNEADKLRDKLQLVKGKVITENLIQMTKNQVKDYYVDKGFLFIGVDVKTERDTAAGVNQELMRITVSNKRRVKINDVIIHGNTEFTEKKIRRKMKGSKEKGWYKIFSSSKFNDEALEKDKEKVVASYNAKGFRDAEIVKDSVYKFDEKSVNIEVWIDEGNKYFFRNITWIGNTKYPTALLSQTLGINRGDVYNQQKLDEGLFISQNSRDISSLYMDDGYLFFQVTPVEVLVENDSIDLEMRIYEGKQATVNRITVKGNSKTNDKVVLREIRTKPGQLFNRSDIIRTQRELAQLGYFDQEKLNVIPKPNPADGTVDIEYIVEERPSDQLELSGGWGGGAGVVGTLGVSFNNFSARNIFKKGTWSPLPTGDGQRLSIRFQSNGRFFQSYNMSFTEPWLGGRKQNSLSVSLFHSVQTDGLPKGNEDRSALKISGSSVGLGRRLKWPDDFFQIYHELTYQRYTLENWQGTFLFSDGYSNNLNFEQTISRNSVDGFIWIRSGSQLSFTIQLTPPFSLFDKSTDYTTASSEVRYKWIEYHKWKFSGSWYKSLGTKFVLFSRAQMGILGYYNGDIGPSPFERFYLGGDGLSGFALDGREIIALRGYNNNTITPSINGNTVGGTAYNKYTMELRFPVSLNPSATIYTLAFIEAGNNWLGTRNFNPFNIKRSAGIGVRIFLPMFGLLGLDWGYGIDEIENKPNVNKGQFHFTIGQQF